MNVLINFIFYLLKSIPDPFVKLHVGNTTKETSPRLRTNDPVWEEGFTFLVRNPKTQELHIEVSYSLIQYFKELIFIDF